MYTSQQFLMLTMVGYFRDVQLHTDLMSLKLFLIVQIL